MGDNFCTQMNEMSSDYSNRVEYCLNWVTDVARLSALQLESFSSSLFRRVRSPRAPRQVDFRAFVTSKSMLAEIAPARNPVRAVHRIHALARRHSSSPRLAIVSLVRVHQTNVTDNLLAKLVTKRSTYLPISRFLFLPR